MEFLIGLFVLFLFAAPLVVSITALVRVALLKREVEQLRADQQGNEAHTLTGRKAVSSESMPAVAPSRKVTESASPDSTKPRVSLEFMMGGKAAAFVGVAILIAGIALLVGFAIQQSLVGPRMRILFGLMAGGALVGIGHVVQRKDERVILLARALTGGGSSLFYFTVYAAYGFYHVISACTAGVGLVISALAVFGLAMRYRSQAVGVLGVLGAFVTPLLVGSDTTSPVFLLAYAALVNVPVILLGARRKWQVLYNLAFVFTVLHFFIWLDAANDGDWQTGLVFACLFFVEFAALGLLKLRSEQQMVGRTVDIVRLVSASLLLLWSDYSLLDHAGLHHWIGVSFVLLALMHFALSYVAFRVRTLFSGEILAFFTGGILFISLALPVQFDGAWVTSGWAIEGVLLAWLARRTGSHFLKSGAFLLGMTGLIKALLLDGGAIVDTPRLFLNTGFIMGMLSAGLIGVQGKIAEGFDDAGHGEAWRDLLLWFGVLGALTFLFVDTFSVYGVDNVWSWLASTCILLIGGALLAGCAPKTSSITVLGSILLLIVPVEILLLDTWFTCSNDVFVGYDFEYSLIQLMMLGSLLVFLRARLTTVDAQFVLPSRVYAGVLSIFSLFSGVGLISMELGRGGGVWAGPVMTLFWAVCALLFIFWGMKRRTAVHRYAGLVLFVVTTAKVLLFDSSELAGLERIAAFIGTGLLLLLLSYVYQKASSYFKETKRDQAGS
ncbi:MAG: DUF2339 domain-containing protein [Spartobacteria bacterium]|nr:DUF2339 domain-containing protein [Spartobacteria bacterium]